MNVGSPVTISVPYPLGSRAALDISLLLHMS